MNLKLLFYYPQDFQAILGLDHRGLKAMNFRLILCLALVLGCGFVCLSQTTPNAAISTNSSQSYEELKSNWTNIKVTVYRANGKVVQFNAKQAVVTQYQAFENGHFLYTNDLAVTAFIDPETLNAWLGPTMSDIFGQSQFYFETKTGILSGTIEFFASALDGIPPANRSQDVLNGDGALGEVQWRGSLVSRVKRGETVEAVIHLYKPRSGWNWWTGHNMNSLIEDSTRGIDNGLDPWLFVGERHGLQFIGTTIEAIDVSNGKLRLDLKGPGGNHARGSSGAHTASVWIDLKTWQVVKVVQDNHP
ncbi:MAG TPA: hypothetical protein VGI03_02910 [Verrucomicrobiae bacterium]|jgi:hypothetical protein